MSSSKTLQEEEEEDQIDEAEVHCLGWEKARLQLCNPVFGHFVIQVGTDGTPWKINMEPTNHP